MDFEGSVGAPWQKSYTANRDIDPWEAQPSEKLRRVGRRQWKPMQDMLCARMPDNLLAKIICSLILHPYSLAAHSKLKSSARPCNVLCVWHRGRTCIQLCMQGQPGQRRVEFKPCMHDQAAIGLFLGDMLICSEVGCRYFV